MSEDSTDNIPDNGSDKIARQEFWDRLKTYTRARIGLEAAGVSIPIHHALALRLSHAHARDAVYSFLNKQELSEAFARLDTDAYQLQSQASGRKEYLENPDLGRKLEETSRLRLSSAIPENTYDICIVVGDGLSAAAVNEHAFPLSEILIQEFRSSGYSMAPVCLASQARVALGDEIGFLLKCRLVIILIGERPGLSSADSMGAYITFQPRPGLTDEMRNCVSNIRPDGLTYTKAAEKINWLTREALDRQYSGIALKDLSDDNIYLR